MNAETKIKLDNATIQRTADGTVTITPKKGAGCVNIGLLVVTALVAVGTGVGVFMGALQLIRRNEVNVGGLLFGVVVTVMFGGYAYYLYRRMRAGKETKDITISPIILAVKIGERVIPFNDIVDIATREAPIPVMEDMVAIQFGFALTNDEIVELGQKAMDATKPEQIEKLKTETLAVLKGAIKRN